MNRKNRENSLIYNIIRAFLILSIIPVIAVSAGFNNIIKNYIEKNEHKLIDNNLYKTKQCLDLSLDVYENLLYDIYTDEEIINTLDDMNKNNENIDIDYSLLRRKLNSIVNKYEHVQGMTIIASNNMVMYYDKLASSSENSKWIKFNNMSDDSIKNTDSTIYFPTSFATEIGDSKYYMFHMVHKIIDYKDIYRNVGTVILSVDSQVLDKVCQDGADKNIEREEDLGENIICDENNNIIYCHDKSEIGQEFEKEKEDRYRITALNEERTNWKIKNLYDENKYLNIVRDEEEITIIIILMIIITLVVIVLKWTKKLTYSFVKVVEAMKEVGKGKTTVKIQEDNNMPEETKVIVEGFNIMVEQIDLLMKNITEATLKQKDAEIAVLESQINPHFLYNTLDVINWKAIENGEFEVSNMISSLGKILRYAIRDSNKVVKIKDELEWLKSYMSLQKSRLSNEFEFFIDIPKEVEKYETHKLLMQPFIENSIKHVFCEKEGIGILIISCKEKEEKIEFCIEDNGIGMNEELVEKINNGNLSKDNFKGHIGISNIMERLNIYYGSKAGIRVESKKGEYTKVFFWIPKEIS